MRHSVRPPADVDGEVGVRPCPEGRRPPTLRREDAWPLGAAGALLLATAAWWVLALWPVPDAPTWLERTRAVCFNAGPTGLPDTSGWILLVGQPLGMVALLLAGWRAPLRAALARLVASTAGRAVAGAVVLSAVTGLGAAGARVLSARAPDPVLPDMAAVPETYPRLERTWPEAGDLTDQRGEPFTRATLEERPALVTFAYAHCETVCPLLVRNALSVRERLGSEMPELTVVVFTLDPWRDTPARLSAMAERWGLADDDFVLSGPVQAVEAALDAWGVPRERDPRTGELTHPALVYLVEPGGTLAYASTGGPDQLLELARRMR